MHIHVHEISIAKFTQISIKRKWFEFFLDGNTGTLKMSFKAQSCAVYMNVTEYFVIFFQFYSVQTWKQSEVFWASKNRDRWCHWRQFSTDSFVDPAGVSQ